MPTAEQVIRRLKDAGYKFYEETEHVKVFKKNVDGKPRRVQVPRKVELEEFTAKSILKQAGIEHESITEFLRSCSS